MFAPAGVPLDEQIRHYCFKAAARLCGHRCWLGTGWAHEAFLRHVSSRRTSDQSGDLDHWRDDGHELRG